MFFRNKTKNKDKGSKNSVGFARNTENYTDLGRLSDDGHLIIKLNNSFEYLGDGSDMKKSIPNVDKVIRMLGDIIVIDLESKEYMALKVKSNNKGYNTEFIVLNSMFELLKFKKFVNKNVAISVNMDALREQASK